MTDKTLLVDIKRNALDDGPGIRTLLFFKGCPLSCVWCQNPEAKSPFKEISFNKDSCSECGTCLKVCNQDAIDFSNKYRIDRSLCNLCGKCIEVCPNHALEFVGQEYSIKDLIEIILKDKIFYKNSGGGVTFSGGEPLYHIDYINELVKKLKIEEIHVCLETSGYYNRDRYCKVSNERILENFEDIIKNKSIEILPRIPLIPNITDTDENLSNLANYLKTLNIKKIGLLPYNPLWLSKPERIGIKPSYDYTAWLDNKDKERIKSIFSDFEFNDF